MSAVGGVSCVVSFICSFVAFICNGMKCKGMKHEINATNETNKHTTTGNRFSLAWVPSNRSFSSLLTVSGSWFSFALFFVFISFPLNYKWSEEKRVNLMK